MDRIAEVVGVAGSALARQTKHIYYIGLGSSGLVALVDASEMVDTYGCRCVQLEFMAQAVGYRLLADRSWLSHLPCSLSRLFPVVVVLEWMRCARLLRTAGRDAAIQKAT